MKKISSKKSSKIKSKAFKKLLMIIPVIVLLIAGIVIAVMYVTNPKPTDLRSQASAAGSKLSLLPANNTVAVGATFPVEVMIDTNGDTISAVDLRLTFDPTAVQITGFTPGKPLPVLLVPEKHDSSSAMVVMGVDPKTPFKGKAVIGRWTFKQIAAKNSSIMFASPTQVAALSQDTNSLASTTGASASPVIQIDKSLGK